MRGEPSVILLVEDDPSHAEIVLRNFENSLIANRIEHVSDGQDALDYLYRSNGFSEPGMSPRPGVILLDLRLPKVDGLDVLKIIKTDPHLRTIPVVVLTTSAAETDIARAYEYHANSYLVKPVDFHQFADMMKSFVYYWLAWNQNPY
jgi:CheY-like chemotaxis protein